MPSTRERRLARLEAEYLPGASVEHPQVRVIIVNEGETQGEAILRTCGPAGLCPAYPPGTVLHTFYVHGVTAKPRPDAETEQQTIGDKP